MATPDYLITSRCVNLVAQISTDFGRWLTLLESSDNDLTDFQSRQMPVKVFASVGFEDQPEQLREVRLKEAYEQLAEWDSSSESDLKGAHQLICAAVTPSAGSYRATGMGVYRNNKLVHMTAPAGQAQKSVRDLLNWLQQSEEHPLLKAAVFLQQFEFIQPFSVANGCIGRLWFSLILAEWHLPVAWLSFEETFKANKEEYLDCLRRSISENETAPMVEFILHCLQKTMSQTLKTDKEKEKEKEKVISRRELLETTIEQPQESLLQGSVDSSLRSLGKSAEVNSVEGSVKGSVKSSVFSSANGSVNGAYFGVTTRNMVLRLFNEQPEWSAAKVAKVLNISSRAVEKHISKLKEQGLLIRKGSARGGYWRVRTGVGEQLTLPTEWDNSLG